MIGGDEMDLSDDESNLKKTKPKTDPIQLQVITYTVSHRTHIL